MKNQVSLSRLRRKASAFVENYGVTLAYSFGYGAARVGMPKSPRAIHRRIYPPSAEHQERREINHRQARRKSPTAPQSAAAVAKTTAARGRNAWNGHGAVLELEKQKTLLLQPDGSAIRLVASPCAPVFGPDFKHESVGWIARMRNPWRDLQARFRVTPGFYRKRPAQRRQGNRLQGGEALPALGVAWAEIGSRGFQPFEAMPGRV